MKRTDEQIERALGIQRKAITASCTAFDAGEKWEALRLATAVANMVHDRGRTISILSHADAKTKLWYVATGRLINDKLMRNFHRSTSLVELETGADGTAEFIPLCTYKAKHGYGFPIRFLTFDEWWEKDIVFFERVETAGEFFVWLRARPEKTKKQERALYSRRTYRLSGKVMSLTRKQLVLTLRDQEGGSHFDAQLTDQSYLPLIAPALMVLRSLPSICRDLEWATMRQIAEELRLTLMYNGAKDIGDFPPAVLDVVRGGKRLKSIRRLWDLGTDIINETQSGQAQATEARAVPRTFRQLPL